MRILLADSVHINKKNFPSLLEAVSQHEVFTTKITLDQVARYGRYESDREVQRISREFKNFSATDAAGFSENEINVFSLCESEMLTFLITKSDFDPGIFDWEQEARIDYYLRQYPTELKLNLAAARYWVRYWVKQFEELPVMHASIVFSGSSTYQKALIEIAKQTQCRNFVIEGTLSGDRFYFEEKYDRIANNSDIKFANVFRKSLASLPSDKIRREHNKAINIYRNLNNKNVVQPPSSGTVSFSNDCKTALILCQVLNDYSLVEEMIHSIGIYKDLINYLSQNGINVIVKCHPWELQKANLKKNHTYNELREFIGELPLEQMKRVRIYDSRNIKDLFSASDFVVGINSQSLLEAATFGFKSIQVGNAFFGNKGFTHDLNRRGFLSELNEILSNSANGILTLDEYENFLNFSAAYFQSHTIPTSKMGVNMINKRLTEYKGVSLVNYKEAESNKLNVEAPHVTQIEKRRPYNKKLLKLKRDPYRFFRDSNVPALRSVRHFFRK